MTAWFRKAAEQGNAKAQVALGLIYESGEVVPQDYHQAAIWYRKAADQGSADAQFSLAGLYLKGEGVPQDLAEVARWTRKAAEQGNTQAQEAIGLSYVVGKGVPIDYVEGYFWLDIAAAGSSDTQEQQQWTESRDAIAAQLTSTQLSQTQERARAWFAAHQSEAATPNDTSNETRKETETSFASSSIQNAAPQEWVKAETDQIRAIVQKVKACPKEGLEGPRTSVWSGPPYNVTWDVSPSQSIRAPYAGYIELVFLEGAYCSQQWRKSSPAGCAIVERPQVPLVLQYEYGLSPDGLSLEKIRARRDNESTWVDYAAMGGYCWLKAAQPTGTAK